MASSAAKRTTVCGKRVFLVGSSGANRHGRTPGPKIAGGPTNERERKIKGCSCAAASRHWSAKSC